MFAHVRYQCDIKFHLYYITLPTALLTFFLMEFFGILHSLDTKANVIRKYLESLEFT